MTFTVDELRRPAAYPDAPAGVEVVQTHISIVCLAGDHVYKVKKAVRLPFLDFSTLERRRRCCEQEVALNRRLCSDVYLGVVPLRRDAGGGLRFGGTGGLVDWAVHMRRLPAERMLDRLLAEGRVSPEEIAGLARLMADFHARADRGPRVREAGSPAALARLAQANFDETRGRAGTLFDPRLYERLEARSARDFASLRPRLERRAAAGHVVDGHGDLHARNVCMTDPPAPYDCLEFSEALRCADTATENAFLTMDLRYRGHPELVRAYVDAYVAASGDAEQPALLPALARYRAMVRAKVAAVATDDAGIAAADRAGARDSARRHLRLAAALAVEDDGPLWLAACGLPASGKTALLERLAHDTAWPHLASDRVRKELAGVAPEARLPASGYTEAFSDRTYAELLRRAAAGGGVVLLDANWPTRARREALRAAARAAGASLLIVHVETEDATARGRLAARTADPAAVSDADAAVYEARRRAFEPPSAAEGTPLLTVRGERPPDDGADAVLAELLALRASA